VHRSTCSCPPTSGSSTTSSARGYWTPTAASSSRPTASSCWSPRGSGSRSKRRRGLLEQLAPRLIPTEHARATLAAVDHGQADVAIVYATDARLARSARIAFEVPDAEQPRIVYAAARVRDSTRRRQAGDFLAFLTGQATRDALRTAGFVPLRDPT
jgi:molybdate transport system substrate-binding protein